jgi:Ferredoxin subunits of nitrite reductase and ring-hydroxylating dioxygenases
VHNTCTHQQQPLHEGTVQDDDTLVCASHNSRFDLTTGESVGIPVVPTLPVYACKDRGRRDPRRHRPAAQRRPHPAQAVPLTIA